MFVYLIWLFLCAFVLEEGIAQVLKRPCLNICFNNSRKLQVGIDLLKHSGGDNPLPRLEKQLGPSVRTALCDIRF